MNKPINLQSKFELFNEHWSPKVIAELNDYQFKLVKIKGQFTWHEHKETDEVFLVIEGSMGIEFKDNTPSFLAGPFTQNIPNPIGSFSAILILLLLCTFYSIKSKKIFS